MIFYSMSDDTDTLGRIKCINRYKIAAEACAKTFGIGFFSGPDFKEFSCDDDHLRSGSIIMFILKKESV